MGRLGSARVWISPATRSYKVTINWMATNLVPGEQLLLKLKNECHTVIDMIDMSGSIEIKNTSLNTGEMIAVILKSSEYIGKVEAKICVEIT